MLVIWAVIIFTVSSLPSIPTLKIKAGDHTLRLDYLIHVAEYAALAFLGFLSFADSGLALKIREYLLITLFLLLFAFVDEFHQKFVPGRTFNPIDLVSNFAGILAALVICLKIFSSARKAKGYNT